MSCPVASVTEICGEMATSGAPSFSNFHAWLQQDYSPYLEFRSAASVRADVERWFNDELGQDGLN